jgi:hypothetical protein
LRELNEGHPERCLCCPTQPYIMMAYSIWSDSNRPCCREIYSLLQTDGIFVIGAFLSFDDLLKRKIHLLVYFDPTGQDSRFRHSFCQEKASTTSPSQLVNMKVKRHFALAFLDQRFSRLCHRPRCENGPSDLRIAHERSKRSHLWSKRLLPGLSVYYQKMSSKHKSKAHLFRALYVHSHPLS